MTDLTHICETLAENLLGWRHRPGPEYAGRGAWVTLPDLRGTCVLYDDCAYLLTGNGMLEIIEAMRERDYAERIAFGKALDSQTHYTRRKECILQLTPEAVVRAAFAALEGEKEKGPTSDPS